MAASDADTGCIGDFTGQLPAHPNGFTLPNRSYPHSNADPQLYSHHVSDPHSCAHHYSNAESQYNGAACPKCLSHENAHRHSYSYSNFYPHKTAYRHSYSYSNFKSYKNTATADLDACAHKYPATPDLDPCAHRYPATPDLDTCAHRYPATPNLDTRAHRHSATPNFGPSALRDLTGRPTLAPPSRSTRIPEIAIGIIGSMGYAIIAAVLFF
jgi:hypothetical protein